MNTAFEEAYNRLNARQKEAVDAIDGPVMVIAGPGTGKTTLLTLRIANILKNTDTPPSGILAITYTEAGVRAMRDKLRALIGGVADEVRIHTFHGFAASVIADNQDHFVHIAGSKQLTEIEARTFIKEILKHPKFEKLRPVGNADFYLDHILSAISSMKREAVSPSDAREYAEKEIQRIKSDEGSYSTRGKTKGNLKADAEKLIEKSERSIYFSEVFTVYEEKKKKERRVDYDDLITELVRALREDELLLRMLQEQFLYILVDEHQDTNASQNFLVEKIAEFFDIPNVCIVGDEKQAIYRFQGASVENFLRFKDLWKDVRLISLTDNYRSTQPILDASFSMIERNYEEGEHSELRIRLVAGLEMPSRPIEVISFLDVAESERAIAESVKNIIAFEPEATVALMARTNREVARLAALLENYGIEASSKQSLDIFSHPAGEIFFALIRFFKDPDRVDMLAKTLAVGLWNASFAEAASLIKDLRSGSYGKVEAALPAINCIRKDFPVRGGIHMIHKIAEESGFVERISRTPEGIEVWRGIVSFAEAIRKDTGRESAESLFEHMLEYKDASLGKTIDVMHGTRNLPVSILTAHGSKGLEFDYVFIPYGTDSSWVKRARPSYFKLPEKAGTEEGLKDSRRLFYVALTRAKKHVVIAVPERDESGDAESPLRFIAELEQSQIEYKKGDVIPSVHIVGKDNAKPPVFLDHQNAAKRMLTESGLSVTALNHFKRCPSAFLYQSVLKLPEELSEIAEKGTAMHAAIASVWSSDDKTNSERIMRDGVTDYFESSLLELSKKESAKKALFEDIPYVAQSLSAHFAAPGEVRVEAGSKHSIGLVVGSERISIPLHGKLDLVREEGDTVYVYDYKTREALSVNAIKGETKNSSGDYFRQLVFYKWLLENDPWYKGKRIVPALVFVVPNKKGECVVQTLPIEEEDVSRLKEDIQELAESVWSGRLFTDVCDDDTCQWCRLKQMLN